MSFETMRKNLVCLWVKSFHLDIFTENFVVNLLMFVTFMSSPVWWQSMSRWWWFMTSDGWTSPPRWLCSGSWCAIGPWPPCISAITMDGFWFLCSFLSLFCHRKNPFEVFALNFLSCCRIWFLRAEGTFICKSLNFCKFWIWTNFWLIFHDLSFLANFNLL